MDSMLRNKKMITLFLLPAILIFIVTVFVPIIWSAGYSFFSWDGVSPMKFVGLANFKKMFGDGYFLQSFKNNIFYMLFNVIGQVIGALFIAVMLTSVKRGRELFKTIYFAPTILSGVAVGQIFQKIFLVDPQGIFNALLELVGLGKYQQAWLGISQTSLLGISYIECYKNIGLYVVIFYAGLISISSDVLESATIDGANSWQTFWKVKLPLISDVFGIVVIMVVNGTLKAFDISYAATRGGPGYSSELVTTYMYKTAFMSTSYGYGSAIAIFVAVESLIAVILLKQLFKHTRYE